MGGVLGMCCSVNEPLYDKKSISFKEDKTGLFWSTNSL